MIYNKGVLLNEIQNRLFSLNHGFANSMADIKSLLEETAATLKHEIQEEEERRERYYTWDKVKNNLLDLLEGDKENIFKKALEGEDERNDALEDHITTVKNYIIYNDDLLNIVKTNTSLGLCDSEVMHLSKDIFDAIRWSIEYELREVAADWWKENQPEEADDEA